MDKITFVLAGEGVSVESESRELLGAISALWAPAVSALTCPSKHAIRVDANDRVWVNGVVKEYPDKPPEALAQVQWYLVFETLVTRSAHVQLHAACVEIAGWRILFSGTSGVGKSTLTKEAILAGAKYLSDDCVVLQDGQALGMGRTIHFDPLAVPCERAFYLEDCDLETFRFTTRSGPYVMPLWHNGYVAEAALTISERPWAVVELERGSQDQVVPLSHVERLRILHEAIILSGREYAGELGFGPTFRLTWNDPKRAFELLQKELRLLA